MSRIISSEWAPHKEASSIARYVPYRANIGTSAGTLSLITSKGFKLDATKNAEQATQALQPVWNSSDTNFKKQPTWTCTGTQRLVTGNWSAGANSPMHVYIVSRTPASLPAVTRELFDNKMAADTARRLFAYLSSGAIAMYESSALTYTVGLNVYFIACAVYNGANSKLYWNNANTPVATGNVGTASLSGYEIGSYANGTYPWTAPIHEINFCTGLPTDANLKKHFRYYSSRTGISAIY